MTKIYFTLITVFVFAIIFNSCDNNPVSVSAEKVNIAYLANAPGYAWYDEGFKNYQPNQSIINEIVKKFNPENEKFCLFVKQACSCPSSEGLQKLFPAFMKILISANIPDSCYEIYSMSNTSNIHPYVNMYKVNDIPSFFLLKKGSGIYSISDTLTKIKGTADSTTVGIEELISKSLNN